jgi:hypothetical protein
MGIDPGTYSLAVCVLHDGKVASCYQRECKRSERTVDRTDEWRKQVLSLVWSSQPDAVGIEIIEPQPWRTKGMIPKGLVKMSRLVNLMSLDLADEGLLVYPQSPSIQSQYPDAVVDLLIHNAMGEGYEILPHLRSATKHALHASAFYAGSSARRRSRA